MKYLLSVLLIVVCGCTNVSRYNEKDIDSTTGPQVIPATHPSTTEIKLQKAAINLRSELKNAINEIERREIISKYKTWLHSYLVDSCKYFMDSMTVMITKVAPITDRSFNVKFESADVLYNADIAFKEGTNVSQEPLYQFIKNLRPSETKMLRMGYFGTCDVNTDPYSTKPFTIDVIPVPMSQKIKMPSGRKP